MVRRDRRLLLLDQQNHENRVFRQELALLAHLSRRRLTRLAYKMAMIRRPASSSVVLNFKIFFSETLLADQVEILYGASLGSGIKILFAIFWSHGQDGRHVHI